MGKKTETRNIYQIGKNNKKYIWDSKYIEKIKNESNILILKSIEIKKFLKKILKDNGLALYKYKINFLESNIKIFISYLKLNKSQYIITKINNKQKLRLIKNLKNKNKDNKNIKNYLITKKKLKNKINFTLNNNIITKKIYQKQKIRIFFLNSIILNKKKNFFLKNFNLYLSYIFLKKNLEKTNLKNNKKILSKKNRIKKRIKVLQYYKYYTKIKNNKIIKNIKLNNFLEKIVESLNIFTSNKFNIILNIQQINKNLKFKLSYNQHQYLRKILTQLRQFKKSNFFKEGVNTILLSVLKKESSQLLANFLANQLKLVKKHNFFLKFIKKALSLLLTDKLLKKNKSIKILIKGRFNGKSRSSKKLIIINKKMPLMSIKSQINTEQAVAYSSNGTFGVKLWINENK